MKSESSHGNHHPKGFDVTAETATLAPKHNIHESYISTRSGTVYIYDYLIVNHPPGKEVIFGAGVTTFQCFFSNTGRLRLAFKNHSIHTS